MKFEFSAGGIVYKHEEPLNENARNTTKNIVVLVCQHSQHHGWVFPKGLIGQKSEVRSQKLEVIRETKEEAALREVKEETGVYGKIIKPLTPITYWYKFGNEKINPAPFSRGILTHADKTDKDRPRSKLRGFERCWIKKTVYYFLMEYISGDTKDHDFEMENVEWLPINEVEKRLTYKSDKKIWKETMKILNIKD